jgi:NADH:ubiquinone oxidoreductase subunit E
VGSIFITGKNHSVMICIRICVGSSCHIKGSYDVITKAKELLKKYNAEDFIELQACFCLGSCSKGVSVEVIKEPRIEKTGENFFLHNVNSKNFEALFVNEIYPAISI